MEGLSRDMNNYLLKFLNLTDKRTLMCVSKTFYWLIHPKIMIYTVPKDGRYTSVKSEKIQETNQLISFFRPTKRVKISNSVENITTSKCRYYECSYGHRFLCMPPKLMCSICGSYKMDCRYPSKNVFISTSFNPQ